MSQLVAVRKHRPMAVWGGRTGQMEIELPKHGMSSMITSVEQNQSDGAGVARWRTQQFQDRLEQTRNVLRPSLDSKHAINWDKLAGDYPAAKPAPPVYLEYPPEPQRSDPKYQSLNDYSSQKFAFVLDYEAWAKVVKQIETENQRRYDRNVDAIEKWNAGRIAHEERIPGIKSFKTNYESLNYDYVKNYCGMVLEFSKFCDGSKREFDLEYVPESKIVIVDHLLPAPDDLVRIKEVKYVKASNEFVEVLFSDNEFNHIYEDILYQMCLRTLHELFDADTVGALSAVVFNGWVESVDKATGQDTKGCVLSVQARKEEFQKINLARVEPKACFKALKGIGSSTLHSLTPIAPVLKINRDDKRFVASHEVAGQLDERFNLAAMDWEDFEHLIRELFEKEFSKPGCEVKVTQASRDGGVDSVVFDPDPIHGGKTVIQAKRYTNTVGVAAVRELYGTVLNEGAMKGILVTTADYGPDAYEFAADKPLVLLNGANLLSLLEKHGHKAKIDLQEAKRILGEKA
jgi:restriction system protein